LLPLRPELLLPAAGREAGKPAVAAGLAELMPAQDRQHPTEQSKPARRNNNARLAQITLVRSQIAPFND
jgi:hypothetical protein